MASFQTAILVLNITPPPSLACIGVTHERLGGGGGGGGGYALYMIVLSALYAAKVCTSPICWYGTGQRGQEMPHPDPGPAATQTYLDAM